MVFVLTNDDGIDAPGIWALQAALKLALGDAGTVVAPQAHHSGCSHQVTSNRPIQVIQRAVGEYAIAGTPADCTRLALRHLCPEAKFVLSGINAGGNLGADVYVSGTVAAVREAALNRVPGIAFSHFMQRGRTIDWEVAARLAAKVLAAVLVLPGKPGTFWNVNLPHLPPDAPDPELVFCPLCTQPLPNEFRIEGDSFIYAGDYPTRARDPGADVEVCFGGNISITEIRLWDL